MARILFTTLPATGHFHPLVPLARAAVAAGHEVAFATPASFCPTVEAVGFRCFPAGFDRRRRAARRAVPADARADGRRVHPLRQRAHPHRGRGGADGPGPPAPWRRPGRPTSSCARPPSTAAASPPRCSASPTPACAPRSPRPPPPGGSWSPRSSRPCAPPTACRPIPRWRCRSGTCTWPSSRPASGRRTTRPRPTSHLLRPEPFDRTGGEGLPAWVADLGGRADGLRHPRHLHEPLGGRLPGDPGRPARRGAEPGGDGRARPGPGAVRPAARPRAHRAVHPAVAAAAPLRPGGLPGRLQHGGDRAAARAAAGDGPARGGPAAGGAAGGPARGGAGARAGGAHRRRRSGRPCGRCWPTRPTGATPSGRGPRWRRCRAPSTAWRCSSGWPPSASHSSRRRTGPGEVRRQARPVHEGSAGMTS